MSDSPQSPASEPWNLESCLDALKKDLSINQLVYDATERALGDIAQRFYPTRSLWEPSLRSMLSQRISGAAHAHSLNLANLDFVSKRVTGETKEEGLGIDGNGVRE